MDVEPFPTKFCRGIRNLWSRRGYERFRSSPRRSLRVAKLGGSSVRKWRLRPDARPRFRLRIRIWSPLRLLGSLKDAYMDTMLRLAGRSGGLTRLSSTANGGAWGKRVPRARSVKETSRDFERKPVTEIYKSIAASRGINTF